MDKNVVLDGTQLTPEMVAIQRGARSARTRGAKLLLGILIGGLVLTFVVSYSVGQNSTGDAALAVFLLFGALLFAFVYFGSNYWQWRVLLAYDIHCPHCEEPLAYEVHLTRRPGFDCPHCGKRALATARELGLA
jgi:DNA-directed RNA polymerase subunit RPC12/RpoP